MRKLLAVIAVLAAASVVPLWGVCRADGVGVAEAFPVEFATCVISTNRCLPPVARFASEKVCLDHLWRLNEYDRLRKAQPSTLGRYQCSTVRR